MSTAKVYKEDSRVEFKNLCPWDVGFYVYNDRTGTDFDILISGDEVCKKLTYGQIENEIFKNNIAFVGLDGVGGHAAFRITDDTAYKKLFGVDKRSPQLTEDVIKKIFGESDRKKFREMLEEYVVTQGEKRIMSVYFSTKIKPDDVSSFIVSDLERHLGVKFSS